MYEIIQSSVDTIYKLEEDTITQANKTLDGYILNCIDSLICSELIVTEDALNLSHKVIEYVLYNEITNIGERVLKLKQNKNT